MWDKAIQPHLKYLIVFSLLKILNCTFFRIILISSTILWWYSCVYILMHDICRYKVCVLNTDAIVHAAYLPTPLLSRRRWRLLFWRRLGFMWALSLLPMRSSNANICIVNICSVCTIYKYSGIYSGFYKGSYTLCRRVCRWRLSLAAAEHSFSCDSWVER